jgi:uncharacterized protein YuzE
MEKYMFDYDGEDDVLYIQNAAEEVEESVEFSEDIILDLDKKGRAIGIEVFYASEFFNLFNKNIDKDFLENLEDAHIEYKEFRNIFFIILVLKSKNQIIRQPMPPLKKSEYVSPLIAN